MKMKTTPSHFLTALLSLLLISPNIKAAESCSDVFLNQKALDQKKLDFELKYHLNDQEHSFLQLIKIDTRLAIEKLTLVSPTLDKLDDFTTPALLFESVFNKAKPNGLISYLQNLNTNLPREVSNTLSQKAELSVIDKYILDAIEIRYRMVVEIVSVAYFQKTGNKLEISDKEYAYGLLHTVKETLGDLSLRSNTRRLMSHFYVRNSDWDSVVEASKLSFNKHPFFKPDPATAYIKKDFVEAINPNINLENQIINLGTYLDNQLSQLKVGISYRSEDISSNIHFGSNHFYGSWREAKSTSREAYIKGSNKSALTAQVDLNISNIKKKKMAIVLDQQHKILDPLFGLENKKPLCFYTCGNYPPAFFIKNDTPIISPVYSVPLPTLASLALQKKMGVKTVQDFTWEWKGTRAEKTTEFTYLVFHEFGPSFIELNIYASVITGTGMTIYNILNDDEDYSKSKYFMRNSYERFQQNMMKLEEYLEYLKKLPQKEAPAAEEQPTIIEAYPKDFY